MGPSEEPEYVDPDTDPIRVAENVLSAWRWDAWLEAAKRIDRSALWLSIVLGILAAAGAAAAGYELMPGAGRFSVILYAPLVGWGIQAWTRSWISTHRLRAVLDDVRPEVVPKLVNDIDDERLLRLLTRGGALVWEQSTILVADRREAAVALVASEYDMTKFEVWDAGSGGGG
jgi:hypothetical protein